jgi:hypothetical protein
MSRAPPTTSESGKKTSGQEAFGSKIQETPVVESPAISTADVMGTAGGAATTVMSKADKAGTSAPPVANGEGSDLCTTGPLPAPNPQVAGEGGARAEDDLHQCLYVGTSWEAEVVADCRDVEEFKEASHTIGRVLSIRVLVEPFEFLALGRYVPQDLMVILFACRCSLLLNECIEDALMSSIRASWLAGCPV